MRAQRVVRPAKKSAKDSQFEALLCHAERFQKGRHWLDLADTALNQKPIAHVAKNRVTAHGMVSSSPSAHATLDRRRLERKT
jgi:hypothetical protein